PSSGRWRNALLASRLPYHNARFPIRGRSRDDRSRYRVGSEDTAIAGVTLALTTGAREQPAHVEHHFLPRDDISLFRLLDHVRRLLFPPKGGLAWPTTEPAASLRDHFWRSSCRSTNCKIPPC